MGTPKALLDYRGKTFVEHLVEVVAHPRIGAIRVVLGAKADEIRSRLFVDPAIIIVNEQWRDGQLSSIHAAIRSLPKGATEALMLCPVDHPIISQKTVARLIEAFDETDKSIILPSYQGRRGHPVIFRATLYGELLAASPEVGARQVVWTRGDEVLEVPTDEEGVILNLDDPAAFAVAIKNRPDPKR
jgi:molybdenum cofactor cytidylyltransferase